MLAYQSCLPHMLWNGNVHHKPTKVKKKIRSTHIAVDLVWRREACAHRALQIDSTFAQAQRYAIVADEKSRQAGRQAEM